jgi:selenocysteine lyase/cysteine desulfurase
LTVILRLLFVLYAEERGMLPALRARGKEVAPRGRSTLVSWRSSDPDVDQAVADLADRDFAVRSLPAFGFLRASIGAWNSEDELERLAALA